MEFAEILRFVFALAFVLGLIGTLAMLAKKMGWADGQLTPRAKTNRLELIESLTLDQRRRLVLVRRDDMEHVLILGASGEIVLDRDLCASPAGHLEEVLDTLPDDEDAAPLIFHDFKKKLRDGISISGHQPHEGDA